MKFNKEPISIYCDEAGFTGNNLLDNDQPYYTYTAIVIENNEAREILESIKKNYFFQGNELKSSNLLKYNQGRNAILDILKVVSSKTKVVAHDKKYALACNIFEYTFEPCFSEISTVFYLNNFHKFISTLLYFHFISREESAQQLFENFQDVMRPGNNSKVDSLIKKNSKSVVEIFNEQEILDEILLFIELNKQFISKELEFHTCDKPIYKWILDLTNTSLYSLLTHLGKKDLPMNVYCDNSKPLSQTKDNFNIMINRTDKIKSFMFGVERMITFNLAGPIQMVNSKEHMGIQLADLISGTVIYCLKNKNDGFSKKALRILFENHCFIDELIFPDIEHIDLNRHQTIVNCFILKDLVHRCINGFSLTEGIAEKYSFYHYALKTRTATIR